MRTLNHAIWSMFWEFFGLLVVKYFYFKRLLKITRISKKLRKPIDEDMLLCYNDKRYFLLLVSQKCTETCWQMLQKYTQMVAVTKCIITKIKKIQENVDAYN